jgi:hypothetical protein
MKQGNRPEGTLWREGGAVLLEPLEGKMQGTLGPESVSSGVERVATPSKEQRSLTQRVRGATASRSKSTI